MKQPLSHYHVAQSMAVVRPHDHAGAADFGRYTSREYVVVRALCFDPGQ